MGDANDWKNKGNDFFKNQDFNSAVECFTKAIELDSSNHIFFSNRSGAYANLGQYEQSLEDANTALKISPSHTNSISRKGHALLNLGKIEESI
jgi:tetratricopeptide (TPR) repeat protein